MRNLSSVNLWPMGQIFRHIHIYTYSTSTSSTSTYTSYNIKLKVLFVWLVTVNYYNHTNSTIFGRKYTLHFLCYILTIDNKSFKKKFQKNTCACEIIVK